jgi:CAAX prenyl protease-like protein
LGVTRFPEVPYIVPFGLLLALLALGAVWPLTGVADQLARIVSLAAVLWWVSRPAIDLRVRHWIGTTFAGVLIFALWIAPDVIFPGYRQLPPFHNAIVGLARSSLSEAPRHDPAVLFLRTFQASIIVPIVEELFWRGWLMRWIIQPDFRKIPLGAYQATSFWVVALLFASEHGPYWDVGLVAGILFNLWMIRTKSLGDLILAHAIANLCLSAYVMGAGKWEYWL